MLLIKSSKLNFKYIMVKTLKFLELPNTTTIDMVDFSFLE